MRGAEVEVWLYGSMEAAVAGAGPPALPPGTAPQGEAQQIGFGFGSFKF
jgi:hypothetical protein